MKGGTFMISWGRYGGFYFKNHRLCLGWIAFTYLNDDIDNIFDKLFNEIDKP